MAPSIAKFIKPAPTATHLTLLLMRLFFGGFMAYGHGWAKLSQYGSSPSTFPADPLGIGNAMSFYGAIGAEFACAILVTIGLMTRVACVPLVFAMGVAYFKVHGGSLTFIPANGASEPAAIYIVAFAIIMLAGPGKFSLDATFFGGKGAK